MIRRVELQNLYFRDLALKDIDAKRFLKLLKMIKPDGESLCPSEASRLHERLRDALHRLRLEISERVFDWKHF